MFRAGVLFLAIVASSSALDGLNSPNLQLLDVEIIDTDASNLLSDFHPRAAFTHLSQVEVNSTIVYSVGARTENDSLITNIAGGDNWGHPRNVVVALKYPLAGQVSNVTSITYAEAIVRQSSPLGYAYVIRGGPGQNHITVIIGALKTTFLGIEASIYGV